jgi:hypothetical protein
MPMSRLPRSVCDSPSVSVASKPVRRGLRRSDTIGLGATWLALQETALVYTQIRYLHRLSYAPPTSNPPPTSTWRHTRPNLASLSHLHLRAFLSAAPSPSSPSGKIVWHGRPYGAERGSKDKKTPSDDVARRVQNDEEVRRFFSGRGRSPRPRPISFLI